MILLASGLLGFAVADLIRWSPEPVSAARAVAAIVGGAVAVAGLLAVGGSDVCLTVGLALGALVVLALWVGSDYGLLGQNPLLRLSLLIATLLVLFSLSGAVGAVGGPLERWYSNLGFEFASSAPVDQFVLALAAGLFLTASSNRVVRLVLDATAIRWDKGEAVLAGGRVLGPLERLLVVAIVLAGDPAAAAIVVTGKGLLRFPEIRSESRSAGPDSVTEYFLIGTFTSLFLAALAAALVLGAS